MLNWLKDKWTKFEAWVYSWMPGFKTKIASGLGAIGMTAGYLQEYITGLPLNQFATATQIALAGAILFTLTFWFRGMGRRVETNA